MTPHRRRTRPKLRHIAATCLLTAPIVANAHEPTGAAPEAAHAADKSGTNPANFSKTLQIRTEGYSLLDGDAYSSKTEAVYSLPLGAKTKLEFEVPFLVGSDLFGPNLFAF
ncbi:MAG: hypothetical protein ABW110_07505, partial [Steroidobacteraceae bacterium]